jgi:hypothetical protein
MLEVGEVVGRVLREAPIEALTDSVPGKAYHLHIETNGISNEAEVAVVLTEELWKRCKADVVWMHIENGVIDLQLYGSPFLWTALIALIPIILALLGISFAFTSIWTIISAIPSWAWALLVTGVLLIFIGPNIGKMLTKGAGEYQERKLYPRPPPLVVNW